MKGRKPSRRRYGQAAGTKVKGAMHERKRGKLRSGRGLSQARRSGAKVPSRSR